MPKVKHFEMRFDYANSVPNGARAIFSFVPFGLARPIAKSVPKCVGQC